MRRSARFLSGAIVALLMLTSACAPAAVPSPTAALAPTSAPVAKPTPIPLTVTPPAATFAPAAASAPTTVPQVAATTAVKPQTGALRIALPDDESTLTPFSYRFGRGLQMIYLAYDTIMYTDADNLPKPLMAREVTASPDATQFDIVLRPGQKWHDGQPVTADDVKFTFEYVVKTSASTLAAPLRPIESVTVNALDSLTIKLKAPTPLFPLRALAQTPILPKHVWESVNPAEAKQATHKIGSGSHRLIEASADGGYRFQANSDYFLGAPYVGELFFPVIKEQNTAFQALRAGQVDSVWRIVPAEQVYDSWVFQKGQGIFTRLSFVPGLGH